MISTTAEYALRAVVHLGLQPGTPMTTETLSAATKVPIPYLYKILRTLAKANLLKISRGRHGGFLLARTTADIKLLEVIDAINPIVRIQHCPLGLNEHENKLCPLHKNLDRAIQAIQEQFRTTSIADLLGPEGQAALCQEPSTGARTFAV